MNKLKLVYLTIVHILLLQAIYLYTSDKYTLARIETEKAIAIDTPASYNGDELTALLESHNHRKR